MLIYLFIYLFIYIDGCDSNPCQAGGACSGDKYLYICDCVAGYTGINCETGTKLITSYSWTTCT